MVVFGRRWGIASDDLVFPGAFELFIRLLWYVASYFFKLLLFPSRGGEYN